MNEKEILKLNDEVLKMNSLDFANFLEKKTKTYQDVEQTVSQGGDVAFKTILALKYKVFILENSKKKLIVYSFLLTIIIVPLIIQSLSFVLPEM
ncbi:MAG: hypothetical protein Q7K40_04340 [bacterium]|nr:hypothetical protein [bacterium]